MNIIEQSPPGVVSEIQKGIAIGVGECLKGPYNTPTEWNPNSVSDFINKFGTYSAFLGVQSTYNTMGGTNGNLFVAFRGKSFVRNIGVRVDLRLLTTFQGATAAAITLTVTGAPISTTFTIPAGTRFRATSGGQTLDVMIDQDLTFTTNGSGAATPTANVTYSASSIATLALFPGAVVGNTLPATTPAWTILDTANLPTGLTTVMIATTNATAMFAAQTLATQYQKAITACDTVQSPGADADLIFSAFVDPDAALSTTSPVITYTGGQISGFIQTHLINFRGHGIGRVGIIQGQQGDSQATAVNVLNLSLIHNVTGILGYAYPWVTQFVPEANATLTVPPAPWYACAIASVNPEEDPGQTGIQALTGITGLETAVTLQMSDYIALKAAGIAAFIITSKFGVEIETGCTTDIVAFMTMKNRRFEDLVEDTMGTFSASYIKKLQTQDRKNTYVSAMVAYVEGLQSASDPAKQRIVGYTVDAIGGNTQARQALGIFSVKFNIKQLPSFSNISLEFLVGETVQLIIQ